MKIFATLAIGGLFLPVVYAHESNRCRHVLQAILETRSPQTLSKQMREILNSKDSNRILEFANELSTLEFRGHFLPDPSMEILMSFSRLVEYALQQDTLKFEASIAILRQKISWYYFGSMLNAATANDALDYHVFMDETARVGLKFQSAVDELKRLRDGIETPIQE